MNVLLLSASKADNTGYLVHAEPLINDFLAELQPTPPTKPLNVVFIPYAGVTISFDEYLETVAGALAPLSYLNISGIHQYEDKAAALQQADVIMVGGGNTFALLDRLYQDELMEVIQQQVKQGTRYIGWSAGSNIAGATIKTTNDMPIVMPKTFDALGFLPVQLNPHYTDYQAPGHHGETREMRLQEFMVLEPETPVLAIQEGSAIEIKAQNIRLVGSKPGFVFKAGKKSPMPLGPINWA